MTRGQRETAPWCFCHLLLYASRPLGSGLSAFQVIAPINGQPLHFRPAAAVHAGHHEQTGELAGGHVLDQPEAAHPVVYSRLAGPARYFCRQPPKP